MTLHDAIVAILESENNRGLIAKEIADLNEEKGLYRRKKDGEFPEEWQIRMRVKNYPKLFRWTPGVQVAPTECDKIFLVNDSRA